MSKVYYNQGDSRWARHPYTSSAHPNATVKSAGCGPTCCAMIVSSTKEIIYPDEMCYISKAQGYRAAGGTSEGLFTYVCNRWGLEIEQIHSSYTALEKIKDGYFVIFLAGNGLWTTGGHYILGVGYDGDKIEIYDPYLYNGKFNINGRSGKVELKGNSAWVQIDTFKKYSNIRKLWAVKVGKDVVEGKNTTKEDTENAKIKYVTASVLNVRKGASTGYSIVGTLNKGTQVLVYEEKNGWSRIGNNKWVSNTYLSDTKPSTNTSTGTKTKYVTASVLNIRKGAGMGNKVVGTLSKNAKVTVYEEKSGWSRIGTNQWVSSSYLTSNAPKAKVKNTVGQTKTLKGTTTLYETSNLKGKQYTYIANTRVKILQNVNASVDKIYVPKTGRTAYCKNNVYK